MSENIDDILQKTFFVFIGSVVLRKYFETKTRNLGLDKLLKYAWVGALPCIFLCYLISAKFAEIAFKYLFIAFIIYSAKQMNDKKLEKPVKIAIIPFLILSIFNDFCELIIPKFFSSYSDTFSSFEGFSLFWLFGFSIYAFNQGKKDRLLRKKELEEHERVLALKNTLEVQVAERTAEIRNQNENLEKAFKDLKATQNQLVHAEKMASLGELTAGIAHEIQNPLNFVNNFSEVSNEICKEIEEELEKDTIDKELILELFKDISQNQEKIAFHGKRAASIVKGMLQHSRSSSGNKELIDLNLLADEYLRLSYHGLRAKNKSFNAEFELIADNSIPKVNVMPQEMGRVLLNLINNAFQANLSNDNQNDKSIIKVKVVTEVNNNQIAIKIIDNGKGISPEIKDKIFQPFFTTKPTGQGTGLGLSMAYEIITKGHGGTIQVDSEVDKGTTFTIILPLN
jgi:two-component system, NtrC family, sensor kinase